MRLCCLSWYNVKCFSHDSPLCSSQSLHWFCLWLTRASQNVHVCQQILPGKDEENSGPQGSWAWPPTTTRNSHFLERIYVVSSCKDIWNCLTKEVGQGGWMFISEAVINTILENRGWYTVLINTHWGWRRPCWLCNIREEKRNVFLIVITAWLFPSQPLSKVELIRRTLWHLPTVPGGSLPFPAGICKLQKPVWHISGTASNRRQIDTPRIKEGCPRPQPRSLALRPLQRAYACWHQDGPWRSDQDGPFPKTVVNIFPSSASGVNLCTMVRRGSSGNEAGRIGAGSGTCEDGGDSTNRKTIKRGRKPRGKWKWESPSRLGQIAKEWEYWQWAEWVIP